MSLFSIVFLIIHYKISKDDGLGVMILPAFFIVEIVLISLMSQSIASITHAITLTMSSLFLVVVGFLMGKRVRKVISS